jgi:NAD(P) transhydrogenase subunit alpha
MIIGAPKEIAVDEKRVAMTPDSATQLQKLGYDCLVQSGAGLYAGFSDAAYEKAGVKIVKTGCRILENCRYHLQSSPARGRMKSNS